MLLSRSVTRKPNGGWAMRSSQVRRQWQVRHWVQWQVRHSVSIPGGALGNIVKLGSGTLSIETPIAQPSPADASPKAWRKQQRPHEPGRKRLVPCAPRMPRKERQPTDCLWGISLRTPPSNRQDLCQNRRHTSQPPIDRVHEANLPTSCRNSQPHPRVAWQQGGQPGRTHAMPRFVP